LADAIFRPRRESVNTEDSYSNAHNAK